MAADVASLPRTNLFTQLCGDAHLSNFGIFAAPDRRLVFDINDFDETLPGPFEWDVKRLAASVVIGGGAGELSPKDCARAARAAVRAYRTTMAGAAEMDPLAIWYQQIELDELARLKQGQRRSAAKQLDEVRASAARKNQLGALDKLTEVADGRRRIRERPPLVVRLTPHDLEGELVRVASFFDTYLLTLPSDRARLLSRYSLADVALKVVGVGSVGTRCLVALFVSGDDDALFLQVKQATRSVLEPFLGAAASEPGQRVVDGQRLIQTAPDPFLGWGRYDGEFGTFSYYVRQLWDGKASVMTDELGPRSFADYAGLCGGALARAHARTGDPAEIAGYLGDADTFDRAVVEFAVGYARVNRRDFRAARRAIDAGEIAVTPDV